MSYELIKTALKNIPRRGQHNIVKILCLALGLAVSSVIIAEIYFEQTYDTYFKDYKRTYIVNETIVRDGEYSEYPQTSGAIAHGLKANTPAIEAATRYTQVNTEVQCEVGRHKDLTANAILADSCFFDVLPRKVIVGSAAVGLQRPFYCMVSQSFAEKAGGDVLGKRVTGTDLFGGSLTIGGVFEDYPRNSSMNGTDIMIAMSTIHAFPDFDGSDMWLGNDRYVTFIRLAANADTADVHAGIDRMKAAHSEYAEAKKTGADCGYTVTQLSKAYTENPYIKTMFWVLSILAFIILFSAVMNYLLIIVSNMVSRSREMAVRKCFGAVRKNIAGIVFSEALVHLVIAIALAALLVFVCKGTIEQFLSAPLSVLLLNRGAWILVTICVVVLLIGGLVPTVLYSRVPIATAFRGYREARNRWKLALLSIQFIATGLLFSLLFIINSQYSKLVHFDPGYTYDNVAVLNIDGLTDAERATALASVARNPDVEKVSSSEYLFVGEQSGDNISLPGDSRELFNVIDMYSVSDGFADLMGIKLIEGRNFTERVDSSAEMLVSREFIDKLHTATGMKGSVVGKQVYITGHDNVNHGVFTICGVYDNVHIGSASEHDDRPSVMFYSKKTAPNMLIRFHQLTAETMQKVRQQMENAYPDRKVTLQSYATMVQNQYASQKNFRNGVLVSGVITLIIALFGLVGYTVDEVNRRSKEIAIRKVNGARLSDILCLFLRGIMAVAIPSVVVGCIGAYLISSKWLESFAERIALTPTYFGIAALLILAIVAALVTINCLKVARSNPMRYLKDE